MSFFVLSSQSGQKQVLSEGEIRECQGVIALEDLPLGCNLHEFQQRSGHWSRIEKVSATQARLTVDRALSFPLYYAQSPTADTWLISDNPKLLAAAIDSHRCDPNARIELLHCGHTLGSETLFEGVHLVPAGSSVTLNISDGYLSSSTTTWGAPRFGTDRITDPEQFWGQYQESILTAFAEMATALAGEADTRLVVPLSGGIDSRLVLAALKLVGAKNVLTFTYGSDSASEVARSREVAEAAAVPWHYVQLDPVAVAEHWAGQLASELIEATWSGFALPHIQDHYALAQLLQEGVIRPGDVVIPGHTWIGNLHHEDVLDHPTPAAIARAAAAHHWNLQGRGPRPGVERDRFRSALVAAMAAVAWDGSRATTQAALEWFNESTRQARYINNSVRVYEHLQLRWEMPLLTAGPFAAWYRGGEELTVDRELYRQFTNRLWAEAFGLDQEPQYYRGPSVQLPISGGLKSQLITAMRATGTDKLLSKSRSIKTQLRHPLAFEAYSAQLPRYQQAARLAAGQTQLGLWAELFLDNRWGGMQNAATPIVPPREEPGSRQ